MRIESDIKLDFDSVLLKPKRSTAGSRADIKLTRKFKTLHSNQEITGVPIIVANLDTTGTFAMAKALYKHNMFVALHKFYSLLDIDRHFEQNKDKSLFLYNFITSGIKDEDFNKIKEIKNVLGYPYLLCIDVANGYSIYFENQLKKFRELYPQSIIMAGNVCTAEMTQELLINCGVDIVKVGIGPGNLCTTRKVTGVGYPQLSAIIECADVAHGIGGHVCADGGLASPGDFCKAFAAGADFVMSGSYFCGTDECEGEWITTRFWDLDYVNKETMKTVNKKRLKVYGMSSREAMEKHYGSVPDYRAPEGRCEYVDYKGPVDNVVQEILGGLRSCCTYVGASSLKDLSKCATFVRIK